MAARLERIEVRAWGDFLRSASAALARRIGADVRVDGPVLAGMAANLNIVALNRVIGLGLEEPATQAKLESLLAMYERGRPRRHAVQVGPAALPQQLPSWLKRRGFHHLNNWVKLYARTDREVPAPSESALRPERIDTSRASTFGEIVVVSFDWPAELASWVAATVGRPGWHHYLAYDGGEPVATGAFYIEGEDAWLDFAATLPAHRGKGAQTSLLAHRMREATERGARLLTIEAAEDRPGRRSSSLHNALRLGFREAYRRPNYVRYTDGALEDG